jgi:hypothetical protein
MNHLFPSRFRDLVALLLQMILSKFRRKPRGDK